RGVKADRLNRTTKNKSHNSQKKRGPPEPPPSTRLAIRSDDVELARPTGRKGSLIGRPSGATRDARMSAAGCEGATFDAAATSPASCVTLYPCIVAHSVRACGGCTRTGARKTAV